MKINKDLQDYRRGDFSAIQAVPHCLSYDESGACGEINGLGRDYCSV